MPDYSRLAIATTRPTPEGTRPGEPAPSHVGSRNPRPRCRLDRRRSMMTGQDQDVRACREGSALMWSSAVPRAVRVNPPPLAAAKSALRWTACVCRWTPISSDRRPVAPLLASSEDASCAGTRGAELPASDPRFPGRIASPKRTNRRNLRGAARVLLSSCAGGATVLRTVSLSLRAWPTIRPLTTHKSSSVGSIELCPGVVDRAPDLVRKGTSQTSPHRRRL